MANPAIGSVVKYYTPSGAVIDALVLSDEGPGFVKLAWINTTSSPAFVETSSTAVPYIQAGSSGFSVS